MLNSKPNAGHHERAIAVAVIASVLLSACASSEDSVSSFLVAPGGYVLYNCDDIARTAKGVAERQRELEQLMAKASTDPAGRIIADTTYGSEYVTTRGQLNNLRAAAAEKNCDGAAGVGKPVVRASDSPIH